MYLEKNVRLERVGVEYMSELYPYNLTVNN